MEILGTYRKGIWGVLRGEPSHMTVHELFVNCTVHLPAHATITAYATTAAATAAAAAVAADVATTAAAIQCNGRSCELRGYERRHLRHRRRRSVQ